MKNFGKCRSLTISIVLAAIIIMTNCLVAMATPSTATNSSATGTVAAQDASANVDRTEMNLSAVTPELAAFNAKYHVRYLSENEAKASIRRIFSKNPAQGEDIISHMKIRAPEPTTMGKAMHHTFPSSKLSATNGGGVKYNINTGDYWCGYVGYSASTNKDVGGQYNVAYAASPNQVWATWIGIGGSTYEEQKYGSSAPLIQAGTTMNTNGYTLNGVPCYGAWYELCPNDSVALFPVNHGDQMGVWIENYDGSWIINVVDYTSGQFSAQSCIYTTDVRSLDWVVEHARIKNQPFDPTVPSIEQVNLTWCDWSNVYLGDGGWLGYPIDSPYDAPLTIEYLKGSNKTLMPSLITDISVSPSVISQFQVKNLFNTLGTHKSSIQTKLAYELLNIG